MIPVTKAQRDFLRRRADHEYQCDMVLTWYFTPIKEEDFLSWLKEKTGHDRYSLTPIQLKDMAQKYYDTLPYPESLRTEDFYDL